MKTEFNDKNTKLLNEEINALCVLYVLSIKNIQSEYLNKRKDKLNENDSTLQSKNTTNATEISPYKSSNPSNTSNSNPPIKAENDGNVIDKNNKQISNDEKEIHFADLINGFSINESSINECNNN